MKRKCGKFRMIHDLSFPYDSTSLNSGIPKYYSEVHYQSVQKAISHIMKYGHGCFMAKMDIKSAFRLIPIHPSEYNFTFEHGSDFYFDRCLQMVD